jgi:hypothetical protein
MNNEALLPSSLLEPSDVTRPDQDVEAMTADTAEHENRPHSARMYNYYLGGTTNYTVDREAAEKVIRHFPTVATFARVNRAFMHRSVRFLAYERGIRQFIDIGTGIPTPPLLHEIAQEVAPETRVAYVDHDPIVLIHADALLHGSAEGATSYIEADATDPEAVLAAIEKSGAVDLGRPVGLSLHALLHFVPGETAYRIVRTFVDRLAPGSYLSLTHCTGDFDPETWQAVVDVYTRAGTPAQVRTHAEMSGFFDGLTLVDPGVVVAHRWRPKPVGEPDPLTDTEVSLYAGVAEKR